MPSRTAVRRLAGLALLSIALLLLAMPVRAAQQEIASDGPLTRIIVSDELNCQVAHRDDAELELFGGELGACGTFLAVDGALYGPSVVPAASIALTASWTPVSQTAIAGTGSAADPLRVVTVVDAGATGLRVEQTDSYVVGSEAYRTDVRLINTGAAPRSGILYRAGDCYLQESDDGYGRVDNGAPACITERSAGSRIEQWLPLTPGSRYMEGEFGEVWAHVASQQPFPNSCRCDELTDNGAGLSWPVALAAGQSAVISHETFFSPVGRAPAAESFRESVPGPAEISLDPLVLAQGAAIAAGLILLIPFPAALFNETLEEHYDEVMGWVTRLRIRLAAVSAALVGWLRGQLDSRRRTRPPDAGAQPPPADGAQPPSDGTMQTPDPEESTQPLPLAPSPGEVAQETGGRDFWRTPQGLLAFILPSALVYAFVDPTFGLNLPSLATYAGLAIGLFIVIAVYAVPLLVFARLNDIGVVVRALPATLLIGVACVVFSRLADFEPGYVYGLIIGVLFAQHVPVDREGRAETLGAAGALVAAAFAWVTLTALGSPAGDDLGAATVQTAAVTVVVAGVEAVVFVLLPVRFMPGASVFAWDRRVWAVLFGIGVFGFVHVLLNPQFGYMADETRASFFSMVVLFVVFALGSLAFWAWFRFRPAPTPTTG